jgi:hypothetical protein
MSVLNEMKRTFIYICQVTYIFHVGPTSLPGASLMVRSASSCLLDTFSFLERLSLSLVDVIFFGKHLVDVFISHIAPRVFVSPCQVT